ncbi:hypothetical protein EFM10_11195, partial [Lactobacillus helveticus]|uniref:hypothetical protein n=1 Tax=Lactobacillus helveticus TaxID=1587 RepID=UPI00218207F3
LKTIFLSLISSANLIQLFKEDIVHTFTYKMFSRIDFLLQRTMSSFFIAIKNLLTAYHIDKQSTGKIIEPNKERTVS